MIESILFLDWRDGPGVKQAKLDAGHLARLFGRWTSANRKPMRAGRFCANPDAKSLGRIADTAGAPSLDLVTKSLRQNGSIKREKDLDVVPVSALDHHTDREVVSI